MRTYPNLADIDRLRQRGYEGRTIEQAIALAERGAEVKALLLRIQTAFAGITLGAGIGLREAQGLDDGAAADTLADLRAQDERLDWSSIPADMLNECPTCLFFFDIAGMAFHLPAFMVADLNGDYRHDLVFSLNAVSEGAGFQALSVLQREAVLAYLSHMEHEPEFEPFQQVILNALA